MVYTKDGITLDCETFTDSLKSFQALLGPKSYLTFFFQSDSLYSYHITITVCRPYRTLDASESRKMISDTARVIAANCRALCSALRVTQQWPALASRSPDAISIINP